MDKKIYHSKRHFKLFGRFVLFEDETRREEVELFDVEPINPTVFINKELNDTNKNN